MSDSPAPTMRLSDGAPTRRAEVGLAAAVVFVIGLLIVPLPSVLLDLFLALSIGLSLVVLLVAVVRAGGPGDFVSDRWREFDNPASAQVTNEPGRLASVSSSNPSAQRFWASAKR